MLGKPTGSLAALVPRSAAASRWLGGRTAIRRTVCGRGVTTAGAQAIAPNNAAISPILIKNSMLISYLVFHQGVPSAVGHRLESRTFVTRINQLDGGSCGVP